MFIPLKMVSIGIDPYPFQLKPSWQCCSATFVKSCGLKMRTSGGERVAPAHAGWLIPQAKGKHWKHIYIYVIIIT